MFKFILTILLLFSFNSTVAKTWTGTEIETIQRFSIKHFEMPKDSSNKYLHNPKAIDLGKKLFHEERLSGNQKVSCNSCHIEKNAFTDNKNVAIGLRSGFRNTSTLENVGQHHWFFADGAKDSLWAQALSSIENPAEHNFSRIELIHFISTDTIYRKQYEELFNETLPSKVQLDKLPDKAGPNAKLEHLIAWKKLTPNQRKETNIIFSNIGKAIAAYVSSIKSKPTRFDAFIDELKSQKNISTLNPSEQRGLALFISPKTGCSNCHSGPLFSNKTFHNIATGIPGKDNGRSEIIESLIRDEFNCLSDYSDAKATECVELKYINKNKHQLAGTYKTSTLRSIKYTAPYMHDGRFKDLNEVIQHYISKSKNKNLATDLNKIDLSKKEQSDLINFLLTL